MKKISNYRILWMSIFLFIVLCLYNLPAAHAEEEDLGLSLSDLLNLEVEIASLFKEDELSAGSTVSAVSPSQWSKMGARRTHEALGNELSVMSYYTLGGSSAIAIRGFASLSSSRGIAAIVDGVPMNDMSYGTSLYSQPNWELGILDKIEMIKGPGSAIYGSDAFHGVISYKTFAPDEDHYSVRARSASNKYYSGNIKASQGFADDKVRIDFAGSGSSQGDQDIEYFHVNDAISPGPGTDKREYDNGSGVLKIRANPTDKLNVTLGTYATTWDSEDFQGLGAAYNGLDDGYDNMDSDTDVFLARTLFSYDLGNTKTLELDLFHWELDYICGWGYQSTVIPATGTLAALMVLEISDESYRRGAKITLKQEKNDMNLQWLVSCSSERLENTGAIQKLTETVSGAIIIDQKAPYNEYARSIGTFLGQVKWSMTDNYHLLFSARHDHYSDLGDEFTPRCGLIINPTKSSAIKLLYGKAFRAPTPSELKGSSAAVGDENMNSETIETYELGYIYKKENYKINITGFYSDWEDGIVGYSGLTPSGLKYANEGESEAYGFESVFIFGMDPFTFHVGLGYVKSTAVDAQDFTNPTITKDRDYECFPELSFIAGIEYHMKGPDILFYLNNRIYNGWDEATPDQNSNADELDTYWRTDFNISKNFSNYKVDFNVRNLFNKENYIPTLFREVDGNEEEGISAMLSVSYNFL